MDTDSGYPVGTVTIKTEIEDINEETGDCRQLQRDNLSTVNEEKQHHLCSIEWLPSSFVFTCGSCGAQYHTICYLHAHILAHGLGGSYHYDNNSRTAFPKYDGVCSDSQTQTPAVIVTQYPKSSRENTSTDFVNLIPRIKHVEKSNSEVWQRNLTKDNVKQKDVGLCATSDSVESTTYQENTSRKLECYTAPENIQQADISLCLTVDSCEGEDDYRTKASERPEFHSASENGIGVKGLVKHEHNYCTMLEPCHDLHQASKKQMALGNNSNDTSQQEAATSVLHNNVSLNTSQRESVVEAYVKQEDGYLELPTVTGESSLCQPKESFIQGTCFKCKLVFSSEEFLQTHMLKHKGRLVCNCCDEIFQSLKELQRHLLDGEGRGSKGVKIIICSYCGLMMMDLQGLKAHLCLSVIDVSLSRQAVRLYTGSVTRKQHVLGYLPLTEEYTLDNSELRVQCEVCKLSFENEYFRILHSVKHTYLIKCRTCSFHFLSTGDRNKHIASCLSPSARITCPDCGKRFKCQANLATHLRLHAMETTDNRCEVCGKTFGNKLCFHNHIRLCSGPKTSDDSQKDKQERKIFKCEKCNKLFDKCHFNRHMAVAHSEARKFACDVCGASFKIKGSLRIHKNIHQKDRPIYKCDECSATFKESISLKRHRKRHLEQFTELCAYCGKMFYERWNLKAHVRQHTGEKPYTCELCGKGFTHNVSRKAHIKTCHQT